MKISILTHPTLRRLGWVTDDLATRALVHALGENGLEVEVHEVKDPGEVKAALRGASGDTLFWGNFYGFSEDGSGPWLVDLLEQAGAPFVGSNGRAQRLLIDKASCQERLQSQGLPVPRHVAIGPEELHRAEAILEQAGLELPVMVKPVGTAGSTGITLDSVQATYAGAAFQCRRVIDRFGGRALVERFLPGRELTLGVLPSGSSDRVLAAWVNVCSRFPGVTYLTEDERTGEFQSGVTTMTRIEDPTLRARLEALAVRARDALGIDGPTRMDGRMDEEGRVRLFDVNGMPGLCPTRGCTVQQAYACYPRLERRETYRRLLAGIVAGAADRFGLQVPSAVREACLEPAWGLSGAEAPMTSRLSALPARAARP